MPNDELELASGHHLAVDRARSTLTVNDKGGTCLLEVSFSERGPVFRMSGASFEIAASERIELACDTFELVAREARVSVRDRLEEEVGGQVRRTAGGSMELRARTFAADADGGMWLCAGDDVDIQGERVRLNCDEPPMPLARSR